MKQAPNRKTIRKNLARITSDAKAFAEELDGGPGSGNFGHEGRPGEVGGSGGGGGGGSSGSKKSGSSKPRNTAQKRGTQEDWQYTMTHYTAKERKEEAPKVAKQLAEMKQGSEITILGERGVRQDAVLGEDGQWTTSFQDRPELGERKMSSEQLANYMLNTNDYSTGAPTGVVIRKDGSEPGGNPFDPKFDAGELKKALPSASEWKKENTNGACSDILERAPVGTYVCMSTNGGKRMNVYKKTDEGTWANAQSVAKRKYGSTEVVSEFHTATYGGDYDISFGRPSGRSLTI